MKKLMLIDSTHSEEVRVCVIDESSRLEELDFETNTKKNVKGNICLAKIIRVEPSLQAAFVDYGEERHGFLPFSEIHPDYFRIPVDDRKAIEEEIEAAYQAQLERIRMAEQAETQALASESECITSPPLCYMPVAAEVAMEEKNVSEVSPELDLEVDEESIDKTEQRFSFHRRYKIQEVIQKNQIILVQVTKEERGMKGAAMTTYLSLAGRYCVLMPNSPRGGGISRKISSLQDRKRLREILSSLDVPSSMSLIIRTAGKDKSKVNIKHDYEYLDRKWQAIREATLKSIAPALVYEEDDLIKRSLRDIFGKDVGTVIVDGERGYEAARNFMKELSPSHIKNIRLHNDNGISLFHRYKVEQQIEQLHQSVASLPSGGSIVINQTEALVAIDINSGKSTRERHIEETAVKTNKEAAIEIARQIRLRDLAGLIVVDFIDMEDSKNNQGVVQLFKQALQSDRARIQVGAISSFGLLEMSRQRLRPSIIEASTVKCSHCSGTGLVRSVESSSIDVLRSVEEEVIKYRQKEIRVSVPRDIALYILNSKRETVCDIERRLEAKISFYIDHDLIRPDFKIERFGPQLPAASSGQKQSRRNKQKRPQDKTEQFIPVTPETQELKFEECSDQAAKGQGEQVANEQQTGSKSRRRGRRNNRRRGGQNAEVQKNANDIAKPEVQKPAAAAASAVSKEDTSKSWWKRLLE